MLSVDICPIAMPENELNSTKISIPAFCQKLFIGVCNGGAILTCVYGELIVTFGELEYKVQLKLLFSLGRE